MRRRRRGGEDAASLLQCGELSVPPMVDKRLRLASRATLARLLAPARAQYPRRGAPSTRPGSELRQNIPIRTFAEWDDARPGFCEVDLVAHCGSSTEGFYLCTLCVVDIATSWVELEGSGGRGSNAWAGRSITSGNACPCRSRDLQTQHQRCVQAGGDREPERRAEAEEQGADRGMMAAEPMLKLVEEAKQGEPRRRREPSARSWRATSPPITARWELAADVRRELRERGVRPDAWRWRVVLAGCLRRLIAARRYRAARRRLVRSLAGRGADRRARIFAGKRAGAHCLPQSRINALLI